MGIALPPGGRWNGRTISEPQIANDSDIFRAPTDQRGLSTSSDLRRSPTKANV